MQFDQRTKKKGNAVDPEKKQLSDPKNKRSKNGKKKKKYIYIYINTLTKKTTLKITNDDLIFKMANANVEKVMAGTRYI